MLASGQTLLKGLARFFADPPLTCKLASGWADLGHAGRSNESPRQSFDRVAVVVVGNSIVDNLLSVIRAFVISIYCIPLGLAIGLAVSISPADASKRLTALWDPNEGWIIISNSTRGKTEYLRKIDYNSTDSATLATQQKGYGTLVWYVANKRPIVFASSPSKWSKEATLKWIKTSNGRTLIEKLRVVGDSHHTIYPAIYDSLESYFPMQTIR